MPKFTSPTSVLAKKQQAALAKARNRSVGASLLRAAKVEFEEKCNGAYLIVSVPNHPKIDYWPGTGVWIIRGETRKHQGKRLLLVHIKTHEARLKETFRVMQAKATPQRYLDKYLVDQTLTKYRQAFSLASSPAC